MEDLFLQKNDYEEPCCPFTNPSDVRTVPIGRIIDKLDEYLNKNDLSAAERHLKYWLAEAESGNDKRGKLSILNEQVGLYRKAGKKAEGIKAIDDVLALVSELGMEKSITAGTTFVNAATGYKAFGQADMALPLYRKAQTIYESDLTENDPRLGGLYNNMALTLVELGSFDEAKALYEKALGIMSQNEHGEAEMAITYCNLADLTAEQLGTVDGEKIISEYLDKAESLLETESLPRNGYYAFVCDKCAPTFGYYGYFFTEQSLRKRVQEIYEGN